jgi:cysteine-rich repeat protein
VALGRGHGYGAAARRLRFVGSDAAGDRFSIQSVAVDQYLCWGTRVDGGLIRAVSLTTTECAWAVRGTAPTTTCRWDPRCGDGEFAVGEACDDGNVVAGDGCSPTCAVE